MIVPQKHSWTEERRLLKVWHCIQELKHSPSVASSLYFFLSLCFFVSLPPCHCLSTDLLTNNRLLRISVFIRFHRGKVWFFSQTFIQMLCFMLQKGSVEHHSLHLVRSSCNTITSAQNILVAIDTKERNGWMQIRFWLCNCQLVQHKHRLRLFKTFDQP